jgi:hypothetical protein
MGFDAHYNLAILLKKLGRYQESKEELQKAALIVNAQTQPYIARYLFDVYSEISEKYEIQKQDEKNRKAAQQSSLIAEGMHAPHIVSEEIENENDPLGINHITYINGKVVVDSEETEKFMKKNFRKCTSKQFFKNYEGDNLYNGRYNTDL